MKKVLIGLGALVVLAIVAVLVGPRFYDWNSFKPEIAARAKAATGRELAIDGDIYLSILPSPTLAVEKVRFANLEGGSAPDMAALDALEVHVALMPLLGGEVQVESVSLVRPTILLERLADGRANWQITEAAADEGAAAAPPQEDGGPAVRLDSIEIEDGTLVYRDAAAGTEERVEDLSATISAQSLQGPFKATGSLVTRGIPLGFEAGSGALMAGHGVPVSVKLTVPETDAQASFGGTFTLPEAGAEAGTAVAGKLQAEGTSLAKLVAVLAPGAGVPASMADSFAVEGEVEYSQPFADLKNLTLRLGDTMATGSVTVDTGTPLFAKAALKLNHLDLDALLATEASPGESPGAAPGAATPGEPAPSPPAGGGFALPSGVAGEFELVVDAIGYRGGVISDARLTAALADGEITITRASALLPGGSDLAVAGTIDAEGGQPRFAGAVEAASDNLRGLLDWFETPLPAGVAPDRLRKLSMTTRVTATPTTVQIADIDLRVDASRVTGGIAIALPEAGRRVKPGFGIGLAVDKLNLDGYLGAVAGAEPAPTEPATQPGATQQPAADDGLPFAALKPLAEFDANVELRVGSLTFHDQTMQGLHLDGTLQTGNLTLRDLSVQEFAGGSGALSGTIADLAGNPRFDTKFDLAAGDAGRALQFAGIDFPGRSQLGRLKLNGTLAGGSDDVAYDAAFTVSGIGAEGRATGKAVGFGAGIPRIDTDLDVKAKDAGPLFELAGLAGATEAKLGALTLTGKAASGADDLTYDLALTLTGIGGDAKLAGKITALSSATPQVDTRLDIAAEKPAGLLRLAGMDGATAGKLGALGVEGTMVGGTDAMRLDLALAGLGGTAKVNGTVTANAAPATFDLAVQANHPELRQLLVAVAGYQPAARELGPLHLTTKAAGSTASANLTELAMEVGESELSGTIAYEAGATRPQIAATLTGNSLDLRGFGAGEGDGQGGGSTGGGGGTSGGGRWSREPLDLSAFDTVDADVDLSADALILDTARIDDLKAKLSLKDGILTVAQLTGTAYGGSVDVKGQLAGRGVPSASGTVVATNIDSGELVKAGFLDGRVTGPLTINADLKTLGLSMAEMMEGLNGSGNVGGTVTVLTTTEQQVGSALLNILGTKVKEVKGLTDTVDAVFSAFAGAPNTLTGDFVVSNGVLDTQNTKLENTKARLLAQGQANLAAWTMDMAANVFRLPSDSPYLTVGLNGALDAPNAKFRGGELGGAAGGAGGALQQIVPGLTGEGGGTPEQPGQQPGGLGGVLQQVIPGLERQQDAPQTTTPPAAPDGAEPGALGTQPAPEAAPAPEPEPVPEAQPTPEAAPAPAPEAAPAPTPEPAPEAAPETTAPAEPAPDASPAPAPEETAPAPEQTAPVPEETAPAPEEVPAQILPEEQAPADQSGTAEPGAAGSGTAEPNAPESGAAEPGTPESGAEPGAGGAQPGAGGTEDQEEQRLEEILQNLLQQQQQ